MEHNVKVLLKCFLFSCSPFEASQPYLYFSNCVINISKATGNRFYFLAPMALLHNIMAHLVVLSYSGEVLLEPEEP